MSLVVNDRRHRRDVIAGIPSRRLGESGPPDVELGQHADAGAENAGIGGLFTRKHPRGETAFDIGR